MEANLSAQTALEELGALLRVENRPMTDAERAWVHARQTKTDIVAKDLHSYEAWQSLNRDALKQVAAQKKADAEQRAADEAFAENERKSKVESRRLLRLAQARAAKIERAMVGCVTFTPETQFYEFMRGCHYD